jgi:CheY-like chemotaxis protein
MPKDQNDEAINILLIEDSEEDVEVARRMLSKTDSIVHLHVAKDGQEAMEFLFRRVKRGLAPYPDLVLLDLALPLVDGLDVLRNMKEEADLRDLPVVVLTGSIDEQRIRECMELGTNMYIVKPMALADVMNILAAAQRYWIALAKLEKRAA